MKPRGAIGFAVQAMQRGVLIHDGSRGYRYFQRRDRWFSGDTVKHLLDQGGAVAQRRCGRDEARG